MGFDHIYHAVAVRIAHLGVGPDKFVHVQVGLAIWCLSAWILRRPLGSRAPLAVVIAAEVANEIMDRHYTGSWNWPDTLGDAASTWFWPVTLFLLLRFSRRLPR